MFTEDEEEALSSYLTTSSNMFHGLTRCATRRLAYEYADRKGTTFPSAWHNKMTGLDWLYGFIKRRHELSLRLPEATSLSCATSFNVSHVALFFDNFESVFSRHAYEPRQIWNLDETGLTTVQ